MAQPFTRRTNPFLAQWLVVPEVAHPSAEHAYSPSGFDQSRSVALRAATRRWPTLPRRHTSPRAWLLQAASSPPLAPASCKAVPELLLLLRHARLAWVSLSCSASASLSLFRF